MRGLVVTNVFGERFWIDAAGSGADADWQRWSMFTIDVAGQPGAPADTSLLLLPTVAKILRSPPTEEILLLRDEVANMVWGVEQTIPVATGESKRGIEAARQTLAFLQAQLGPAAAAAPVPANAPIRYRVMNTVPENWIPFIPVHVDGSNRDIQLQRAAMPRILEGDPNPPVKIQPRTVLLREGLDRMPPATLFRVRGRGAARRRAADADLRAHALDRRQSLHVAARATADRPRRGLERPRLR